MKLRNIINGLCALGGIAILAACTGGQAAVQPPAQQANLGANVLTFRVGTANFQGTTYFNVVSTLRQPGGLSAALVSNPNITGPAGFTVPAVASAGTDAGTNRITSTPPTQPGTTAVATTFGTAGGDFVNGFAPANTGTTGAANYAATGAATGSVQTGFSVANTYAQPIYTATNRLYFLLGPPATPNIYDGTYPTGFAGYDSLFTIFATPPVAGTYSETVNIPGNSPGAVLTSYTATATLANPAPLATAVAPVLGGAAGAVTVTVGPAPAGATAQVVYVVDRANKRFYTYNAGAAGGTTTLAIGTAGNRVQAYAVAADFDIVGNAAPNSTAVAPTLPAQTDVSVSTVTSLAL